MDKVFYFTGIPERDLAQIKMGRVCQAMAAQRLIAKEIKSESRNAGDKENFFLTALLHNLGEVLIAFYLPEEDKKIKELIEKKHIEPAVAQQMVLNIQADEIATEVATSWKFPTTLVDSIPPWPEDSTPMTAEDEYRVLADLSSEISQSLTSKNNDKESINDIIAKYKDLTNINSKLVENTVNKATEEFLHIAEAMPGDIPVRLVQRVSGELPQEEKTDQGENVLSNALDELQHDHSQDTESILMDGLQEATTMLTSGNSLQELFSVVLETIYRAMDFDKVILAVNNKKTKLITGRIGFGDNAAAFSKDFVMPAAYQNDIFHAVLKNNVDVYINDTSDKKIQLDLPSWFKKISDAGCFLLLPITINKKPLGLIYAEQKDANGLKIDKKKLSLLKSLRNQLVLACRNSG